VNFATRASILALALSGAAHALAPDQIFERAAPGVWALRALDANNQPFNHGSAVAITGGKAITSCSLLARAGRIELHRGRTVHAATLEFPDAARDLCQLDVPGLQAPEPSRAAPRMGQRVYVIGYERGAEAVIAEGLFSRVREAGTDAERIQTTVPASGGLLGAGLYDDEARLLGVVSASASDAAGAIFALPAKWFAEVPERGRASLAAHAAGMAAKGATVGLPAIGATWTYRFQDLRFSNTQTFALKVLGADGWTVREAYTPGTGSASQTSTVSADDLRFFTRRLAADRYALEFAPYLLAKAGVDTQVQLSAAKSEYPGSTQYPWIVNIRQMDWEEVTVPAGTFKALRIDVAGRRNLGGSVVPVTARFVYKAWYVPEVRRYVKMQHQSWSANGALYASDLVELASYKLD